MDNDINKKIDGAMNSLDTAGRATARPYLLTRINARMQRVKENKWDAALRFISKPAIVVLAIILVITINATVITYNFSSAADEQQYASVDEYSGSAVVLNDIENIEP
jgi:hypothetical protein